MLNLPSALVSAPYLSHPPLLNRRRVMCARSTGIPLTEFRTSPSTEAGFSSARGGWVCARPRAAAASSRYTAALFLRLRIGVPQRNHLQVLRNPVAFLEFDLLAAFEHFLEDVRVVVDGT